MPVTRPRTMPLDRSNYTRLEEIPNVGPATAADLRLLGIQAPRDLIGRDPYLLYDALCTATNQYHDPCVIDVFIAAVRFMEGAPEVPWWHYTPERKAHLATRTGSAR